jgi:hypothetical protein
MNRNEEEPQLADKPIASLPWVVPGAASSSTDGSVFNRIAQKALIPRFLIVREEPS